MIKEELKELKTTPKDLRNFGLILCAAFAILGFIFLKKHIRFYPLCFGFSLAFLALSFALPHSLKPIYKIWMIAAILLGFCMSNILLTFVYFFILTPTGFLARLFSKKFLDLSFQDPQKETYWIQRKKKETDARQYEKQF